MDGCLGDVPGFVHHARCCVSAVEEFCHPTMTVSGRGPPPYKIPFSDTSILCRSTHSRNLRTLISKVDVKSKRLCRRLSKGPVRAVFGRPFVSSVRLPGPDGTFARQRRRTGRVVPCVPWDLGGKGRPPGLVPKDLCPVSRLRDSCRRQFTEELPSRCDVVLGTCENGRDPKVKNFMND